MRRLIAVLAAAAVLTGCSGAVSNSTLGNATPQTKRLGSISFTFQTVDNPGSSVNRVNGINQAADIVGTTGDGNASPFVSYISQPPYNSFQTVKYTGAQGTVVMNITSVISNPILAGYVIHPPQLPGIWGYVQINGLPTLLRDRKGGKGPTSVSEILGANDSAFGVGYYKNAYGHNAPVVVNIPTERWTALKPPGAVDAKGTGINAVGDITGSESGSPGTVGFFVQVGHYYTFAYPGATATYALGINSQDQIVGNYLDANGKSHGFLLTGPKGGSGQTWQAIDEPNGAQGTVVTGVNDNDAICGYYVDGSSVQHGFVATPN
jgi:hypothetical protein